MFGIDNLSEILEHLTKLGINITTERLKILEWRLSDEGKKYYNDQENIDFYKALSKGKVRVLDLIRKDKQKRINDMLKKIGCIFIPIMCCFLVSCAIIGSPVKRLDEISIKETEKTYQLKNQQIKTEQGQKQIDENWFMVHKDYVVTFNENQDNLLKILEINTELQNQYKKTENRISILYGVSGTSILIVVLLVFILIFTRTIKK